MIETLFVTPLVWITTAGIATWKVIMWYPTVVGTELFWAALLAWCISWLIVAIPVIGWLVGIPMILISSLIIAPWLFILILCAVAWCVGIATLIIWWIITAVLMFIVFASSLLT